jgi:hypothetical protein
MAAASAQEMPDPLASGSASESLATFEASAAGASLDQETDRHESSAAAEASLQQFEASKAEVAQASGPPLEAFSAPQTEPTLPQFEASAAAPVDLALAEMGKAPPQRANGDPMEAETQGFLVPADEAPAAAEAGSPSKEEAPPPETGSARKGTLERTATASTVANGPGPPGAVKRH